LRYFFLFSSLFLEWPLAIARRLATDSPSAQFMGLTAGKDRIYRPVRKHRNPPIDPLYKLSELEKEWLTTPASTKQLTQYETIFGQDFLNRVVASDREIGFGWISGAIVPETRLIRLSQDTEYIRRYVVGLLDFLFRVFEEQRPDLVFCYVVAGAPAYCLSKVSEQFGVPFRRLTPARIGSKYILDDTPEGMLGPVCKTYKLALDDPKEVTPFLPEARDFLKTFRKTPEQPEYQRSFNQAGRRARSLYALPGQLSRLLLAALKVVRPQPVWHEPTDWARRTWQLRVNLQSLQLSLTGPFRAVGDIPRQPFAFFPLHIDPEESTMVRAPLLTNQVAVIEALSKSLPLGMDLVVKEHATMVGRRPPRFYTMLSKMPKVILASPFENTFDLIRRATLTCAITSTAIWEAMMLQRPALVLGEMFPYLTVGQGVNHCPELSMLPSAITHALKSPPISEQSLELFIASMLYHSFDFPVGLLWGKITPKLIEDHQNILETLCERLETAARKGPCGAVEI